MENENQYIRAIMIMPKGRAERLLREVKELPVRGELRAYDLKFRSTLVETLSEALHILKEREARGQTFAIALVDPRVSDIGIQTTDRGVLEASIRESKRALARYIPETFIIAVSLYGQEAGAQLQAAIRSQFDASQIIARRQGVMQDRINDEVGAVSAILKQVSTYDSAPDQASQIQSLVTETAAVRAKLNQEMSWVRIQVEELQQARQQLDRYQQDLSEVRTTVSHLTTDVQHQLKELYATLSANGLLGTEGRPSALSTQEAATADTQVMLQRLEGAIHQLLGQTRTLNQGYETHGHLLQVAEQERDRLQHQQLGFERTLERWDSLTVLVQPLKWLQSYWYVKLPILVLVLVLLGLGSQVLLLKLL